MYKRLYRLLIFSVCMVVVVFVLNILNFGSRMSPDWPAKNWKRRWFMLDGWLNILYFIVFLVIVILWRPTDNNARYGLEQLSQDEDEAMDLENNLRRAEGLGYDGMKGRGNGDGRMMDDEAAIFELGDEESDDEGGNRVKLMSVGASSSQPKETPRRELNRGGEQSGLLDEDDQDDEYVFFQCHYYCGNLFKLFLFVIVWTIVTPQNSILVTRRCIDPVKHIKSNQSC